MAPVCVHRASRTPPDIAPRHIGSRDGLQEDRRPDTELPHTALRTRLVPCPTLSCNSSVTAIAILRAYRAYPLARWHRFVSIERREPLQTSLQGTSARAMVCRKNPDLPHTAVRVRLVPGPTLSCNSSVTAIAILGTSRAYPLARWHRFVFIARREPLQTSLQGTSARAMISRKLILSRSHNKKQQKKDKPLDLSSVVAGEGLEPPASGL